MANDDLISRQAAIDVLNKLAQDNFTLKDAFSFYLGALHDVSDGIKALPAAQRWIPVTERLPKESDGRVLITISGKVETGKYSEFSKRWYIGDLNAVGGADPIAWMPLPECYKG